MILPTRKELETEYLTPEQIESVYPIARFTVYDWQYRPAKYKTPVNLTLKFNGRLYIKKSVLNDWMLSKAQSKTVSQGFEPVLVSGTC